MFQVITLFLFCHNDGCLCTQIIIIYEGEWTLSRTQ